MELSDRTEQIIAGSPLRTLARTEWSVADGEQIPNVLGMSDYARAQLVVIQRANILAVDSATEPAVRAASADITEGVEHIPSRGPAAVAWWVRNRIRYRRESPFEETLAGPLHTLRTRVGDCDDKAVLFASLCVSLGLPAYVAGVYMPLARGFVHAIGAMPGPGGARLFEVSDDRNYGSRFAPMVQTTRRSSEILWVWDVPGRRWLVSD